MGLRDLLNKKDKIKEDGPVADGDTYGRLAAPEVRFIRSDTFSEEVIHPPDHTGQQQYSAYDPNGGHDGNFLSAREAEAPPPPASNANSRRSIFSSSSSRSRGSSVSSRPGSSSGEKEKERSKHSTAKRLSQRLHLSRSPASSEHVPQDLPEIVVASHEGGEGVEDKEHAEEQWEKRATILAAENERVSRSRSPSVAAVDSATAGLPSPPPQLPMLPQQQQQQYSQQQQYGQQNYQQQQQPGGGPPTGEFGWLNLSDSAPRGPRVDGGGGGGGGGGGRPRSPSMVSSKAIDDDIQEAIRLHETGELVESTRLFGRLADPNGANNPLSQVLYGLALRHGWGCEPDPEGAVHYLSKAASNAAVVENLALQAGMKKGGAAKGELVLAIFELANCFRHGWGIAKDPVAAKQYYETAANLGDTDAMNEVAWCYLEGFGTKKDKFAAAKYYRLAEQNGNKTLGNSWIWKDKYTPGNNGKKK